MNLSQEILKENIIAEHKGTYKPGLLAKAMEMSITITVKHIYGKGYVLLKDGSQEEFDPDYQSYIITPFDILNASLKNEGKFQSLHIECKPLAGGIKQEIIINSLKNAETALQDVLKIKTSADIAAKASQSQSNNLSIPVEKDEESSISMQKSLADEDEEVSKPKKMEYVLDSPLIDLDLDTHPITDSDTTELNNVQKNQNNTTETPELIQGTDELFKKIENLPPVTPIKPIENKAKGNGNTITLVPNETKSIINSTPSPLPSNDSPVIPSTEVLFKKMDEIGPNQPPIKASKSKKLKRKPISVVITEAPSNKEKIPDDNEFLCPECKAINRKTAKFCYCCGYKFNNADEKLSSFNPELNTLKTEEQAEANVANIESNTSTTEAANNSNTKKTERKIQHSKDNIDRDIAETIENIEVKITVSGQQKKENEDTFVESSESPTSKQTKIAEESNTEQLPDINSNIEKSSPSDIMVSIKEDDSEIQLDEVSKNLSLEEFEAAVRKLKMLKDSNMISREEFNKKKKQLLNSII